VLALAVVVAALVPATCGQAPPFHPGPLGAVAYVRDEAVHVVDVSTHRDRVVAHLWLPSYEAGVSWSGDGRWLAVGDDLVPAAGGQLCRPFSSKTGLYGDDPSLRWSPKGELLAVTTAKGVFLVRPGGKPRNLLSAGWSADGFSPGGGRIAAEGPTRAFELWNVALATGERTLLYRSNAHDGPPELARWTPDGRWILFWTDTFESGSIAADGLPLLAVPAAGGPAVTLAPLVLRTPQFVVPCGPGRVLVVTGFDRYVSAHKSLELFTEGSWTARGVGGDASHSWFDPSCSPDGKTIAATATVTPGDENGFIDSSARMLRLLRPGGGASVLLGAPHHRVSFEGARFSRDGQELLYVEHATRYGAPEQLRLLDVATNRSRFVANIGGGLDYYGLHNWSGAAAWYEP
jgi:hypothetical protein